MKWKTPDKSKWLIITGFSTQLIALLFMAQDPVSYGLGPLTLWLGALLFGIGLLLPIVGFTRWISPMEWLVRIKGQPLKSLGFLISLLAPFTTYVATLEPTASLWDCSETIAAAYKLQVPHTPGTPLTLLLARLFAMLALGDVFKVAWFINLMSACFSALAVSFTFLITWYFGSKVLQNKWVLLSGSLGGALCLAFSDTFWFSAVEAETYGPSVFFIMLLIWLAIQSNRLAKADRKRTLLRFAYLTGLSYCIHPMCILILPVGALILSRCHEQNSIKRMAIAITIGMLAILFINKVIAVDLFEWAFQLDLLLVNKWSFPFYSGVFVLLLVLGSLSLFVWKKYRQHRLLLAAVWMLLMGFSPYVMLFVRSAKMPPINEFTPNNLAKIKPYMNRESYPSRPLLYGKYFDAEVTSSSVRSASYVLEGDRYEKVGEISKYHYQEDRMTILPRIYSNDPAHIQMYKRWTGLKDGERPRFSDNLKFMFRYQLGYMYGRYLLWNFAGRAGDVQGADWLAPWEGVADRESPAYSRAHNQYFLLPFLLGILGMYFQFKKDRLGWGTSLSFFLLTGLLLALFLNATPSEARERDYIFVGSYVAFSIWIGLGIMFLIRFFPKSGWSYGVGVLVSGMLAWVFYQNWDDHDRSGRTFQVDHARNVLAGCEQGAVLFTGGDNDTFPLWYVQEVEGFRTDVRVMVMSYFNADWYINQLSRPYYDSPPLRLTLQASRDQYGPFDPPFIQERIKAPISWGKYMTALKAENPNLMIKSMLGGDYQMLPSRKLNLSTSKGTLSLDVKGNYLPKSELAILDVIHSNGWERPIYFNFTALNGLQTDLAPYLRQEGLVYRLVPERSEEKEIPVNLAKSYENLVRNADYSNLIDEQVYFNHEDFQTRMITPIKFTFNALINGYEKRGDQSKVEELVAFTLEQLYVGHLAPSYAEIQLVLILKRLGRDREAKRLLERTFHFFYRKVKDQADRGYAVSDRDLFVFQESVRLLGGRHVLEKYKDLMMRVGNRNKQLSR